ncbi:MAG TPA: zinc finger domain-containing protein [Candidatus Thermoplasmatota archaeon]|nr:zinc finger domain-containing protein [Candidatus Thermoplasmatota archaeon]
MKITDVCTSCGTRLLGKGATSFNCPACGEGSIGRCPQCRDQSVLYKCEPCGFVGP